MPPPLEPHAELLQPAEQKLSNPLELETARATVLIVEDDPSHREFLMETISGWGYRAMAVGSSEEAEFVLKRHPVDVAVVDVFLPGRSGTTLMTRLRERFPDIVLIGISAMSDSVMARRCKTVGADLFIGKPIPTEQLAQALASSHHSWH